MANGTVALAPVWSVTVRLERNVPALVPVPVMAPVAVSSAMPGGSEPLLEKTYGARPPTAFKPVVSGALTRLEAVKPVVGAFFPVRSMQLERCEDEDREGLRVVVRPVRLHGECEDPARRRRAREGPVRAELDTGRKRPAGDLHELAVPFSVVSAGGAYPWSMFVSGRLFVATNIRTPAG